MGAHSFLHKIVTDDPQGTYEHLVKEAYYYHGHDSYNGTISTTSKCVEHFQHFNTDVEVDAWLETSDPWKLTDKWDACKFVRYPETKRIAFFGWAAC